MKWGVRQEDKTIQDKIIDSVYAQQNNLIVGRAGAEIGRASCRERVLRLV